MTYLEIKRRRRRNKSFVSPYGRFLPESAFRGKAGDNGLPLSSFLLPSCLMARKEEGGGGRREQQMGQKGEREEEEECYSPRPDILRENKRCR